MEREYNESISSSTKEGKDMQNKAFHRLLSQLNKLTPTQSKQLKNKLKQKCSIKTIENITSKVDYCPHCGTTSIYKWGYRSGLQRYKCKECHKTFNTLSKIKT